MKGKKMKTMIDTYHTCREHIVACRLIYISNIYFTFSIYPSLLCFLIFRFKISTSKMCMVGDRLDTDILFGQNAGCKTLLVFSGPEHFYRKSFICFKKTLLFAWFSCPVLNFCRWNFYLCFKYA